MPGMLFHIALAEYLKNKLLEMKILTEETVIDFYSGNLIPDLAVYKDEAHYEMETRVDGVFSPDMKVVKEKYFVKDNALLLGVYCHLLLDNVFINRGLLKWFKFNPESRNIKKGTNLYTYNQFFGELGIYGDYTKMNFMLFEDGWVSHETIGSIPEIIKETGYKEMDTRRSKTWKQELQSYLEDKEICSFGILEYNKLLEIVVYTANLFLKEF